MQRTTRLALLLIVLAAWPVPATLKGDTGDAPTFENHVRPILKAYCFACHGEGPKLKGGLDLRLRRLIVEGGDSGPAVQPGQPGESLLYERVEHLEMPPGKKKLSPEQVALIRRWIAGGARAAGSEPETVAAGMLITPGERAFWAFQPIRRPEVPRGGRADRTPIDAFVREKLEQKGLSFAPEADKPTLIRRAFFDLIGLPPTPGEVADFLADPRPDAYERLIDRLLASPHYGERWGRHWLDVAGYADSDGYASEDAVRGYAYKYRDHVIRSFNADQPFDAFVCEQLAGDEMIRAPYRDLGPDDVEKLVATGFLRMAPDGTGSAGVDQGVARNQVVADTLKVVSASLLGLTVGCAQCHDHRYDPISQADYYRLRAVFEPAYDWKNWRTPAQRLVSLYREADRARAREVEAEAVAIDQERLRQQAEYIHRVFERELEKLPEEIRAQVRSAHDTPAATQTPPQKKLLKEHPSVNVTAGSLYLYDRKAADDLKGYADRAAAVRARKPKEEFVQALTEVPGKVPTTYLFYRGDHEQPKQALEPAGLTVLDQLTPLRVPAGAGARPTTGRRLAFARWLTDGKHPLTARVLVNRVWMHHFGRGIVGTPADFGFLGERPTHPELLDWLAREFMEGGWRLKRLHRLIMTSTTYRQASRRDAAKDAVDPDNRLLGRMSVRRLEAEVLRDAMLAVSGQLNRTPGGTPVPVRVDELGQVVIGVDTTDSAGRPTGKVVPLHGAEYRRSVYVQVRRSRPLGMLEAFDAPTMEPNCEMRTPSTVAPQSLLLMNNEFVLTQSEAFAGRVRREAGEASRGQIVLAWRLAFGTEPNDRELEGALKFIAQEAEQFRTSPHLRLGGGPRLQALASFCQALINSNAFLYVD